MKKLKKFAKVIVTVVAILCIALAVVIGYLSAPSKQMLPPDEMVEQYISANDLFVMYRQTVGESYTAIVDDAGVLHMLYVDKNRAFQAKTLMPYTEERMKNASELYIGGTFWPITDRIPFLPLYIKDEEIRSRSLKAEIYYTNGNIETALIENGYCIVPAIQSRYHELPIFELVIIYDRNGDEIYRFPAD